jgi:hypothetical protein
MRKAAALVCVVFALVALGSCAKYRFGLLPAQEDVIIHLTKECTLAQRTPNELRTSPGRVVRWHFVGPCPDRKVGIRPTLTKEPDSASRRQQASGPALASRQHQQASGPALASRQQAFDLFDLGDKDTKLEDNGPDGKGAVVLSAKLRGDAPKGHYKYQILIDGKPAQFNSDADEGSLFICPTGWPCTDGFKEN